MHLKLFIRRLFITYLDFQSPRHLRQKYKHRSTTTNYACMNIKEINGTVVLNVS